jgi:diadenosine tetraphosphate (Ap4A) HIT family hydrolase
MTTRTAIHDLVDRCHAGECASLVTRMPSGWLILAQRQVLTGYCLLLPDPVVAHLNDFDGAQRERFLCDMAAAGDALLAITAALRINYAMFGNVEPALHAHLFPRRADEPAGTRTAQPWALDWDAAPTFSENLHGGLRRALGAELGRRGALS